MSCSNLTLYLFDMLLRFKIILEISAFTTICFSFLSFFFGFMLCTRESEKGSARMSLKVSFYLFLFSLAAIVLIIFLPSKEFLDHVITNGC